MGCSCHLLGFYDDFNDFFEKQNAGFDSKQNHKKGEKRKICHSLSLRDYRFALRLYGKCRCRPDDGAGGY